ncbi:inositol-pentakisphosphate 2-kinase-like isoform X1 [Pararge aegeria]|uniref:inositol-pentakisphosphate 2-kinase-like isoform X1 n=1 Tax=Pararge aegeria TaxID=116150 RepID=UPI0019CFDAF2|nr:inositol-pentakisphosphate 2-kinase-like isoform X1 [Pararge aegeria]
MTLIGKKYKYINEGNAHIVLHITDTDYVIRIIKENGRTTDINTVSNCVNFVNIIMVPLIFGYNKYNHEIVKLSSQEIANLTLNLKEIRPKHRQIKSVFSKFAIKAPNLAMITPNSINYCLELKPKEGFLSHSFKNISKCYYCLKQFLKVKEKQIEHRSSYCPLDLFSGDKQRMKRGLLNLLRNPQNNLKLFINENVVYNESSNIKKFEDFIKSNFFNSVNIFLDFIINILLGKGNSNLILEESPELTSETPVNCTESKELDTESFLYKLLLMQKIAEIFKIETANVATDKNDHLEYVPVLLNLVKEQNLDLTNENDRIKFLDTVEEKHLALISAVAKDCSIMIAYSLTPKDNSPSIKFGDMNIFYTVSVTDLEPKGAKTLAKRKKTEKMLLEINENILKS